MSELSRTETSSGVAELEGPEKIGSLLEIWTDSEYLMNQVLHTDDAIFSKVFLNEGVVSESNALLVNLAITTLVYELSDSLEIGISISNPGLDNLEHFESGLRKTDEDTIVNLEQTKKLKDLARLRCNLVYTMTVNRLGEL